MAQRTFCPDVIVSQFNHIFIIVQKVKKAETDENIRTMYRVTCSYKKGVSTVQPAIPAGTLFEKTPEFRKLLLAKLINSERSAYRSDSFKTSKEGMRYEFLLQLHQSTLNPKKISRDSGKARFKKKPPKTKPRSKTIGGAPSSDLGMNGPESPTHVPATN
mmetsp:Transcript_6827/g.7478  ORF Transcript_6827/g.7478 Transcript_6827/m.7478 type:complete len:160 (+) Transcript_6827:3-482(+)